jgi:UDPglucose--hexose-1-phosphate uridylyltransferase
MNWREKPHRRWNALTREWVLVSPQRTQRPWQGQVESRTARADIAYVPDCYLCPGNERAGGARNPAYTSTFVFDNDFAALRPDTPQAENNEAGLLVARAEKGICRVVCFSPNHSLTVARMSVSELRLVVDAWVDQFRDLGREPFISYVQIFENRGEMMGASNPHPHCQIWATETLPNEIVKEQSSQTDYLQSRGACLLCEYLKREMESGERTMCENRSFAALVPFWAVWPFEVLVISKAHIAAIDDMNETSREDLADILKRVSVRGDNLFESPFPYTMGFHQRPTDNLPHPEWHLHAHYYPPLLRSATVRKFMVGFELLCMPQRDITPESAATRLRAVSDVHYLDA